MRFQQFCINVKQKVFGGAFILLFLIPQVLWGQMADENQIKSAYIEKLTRFITWPNENSNDYNETPFVICIVGNDKILKTIESDYANRTIKNKKVLIKQVDNFVELFKCDMVFLSKNQEGDIGEFVRKANEWNMLIFSHSEGFAEKGAHLNFYIDNERVRFEVNYKSLLQAGLNAQSLLLDYARIVQYTEK